MRLSLIFALTFSLLACSDDSGDNNSKVGSASQSGTQGDASARQDASSGSSFASDAAASPKDAAPSSEADATTAPVGTTCGTRGAKPCGSNEYCDFGGDPLCGATDKGGVCRVQQKLCPQIYLPVCGCDGKTYGNGCSAGSNGVSVAHDGACEADAGAPTTGKTCGGIAALKCGAKEFCDYELGQGCSGIADAAGQCATKPEVCDTLYDPVCGCDNKTYSNACDAHSKGASVKSKGACK